MTDNSSETTEVMPTAEPVAGPPQVPVDAPAPEYVTPTHKPVSGTSKVVIVIAAVVLGLVVLGGTFASGAMVGSHVGGGRGGAVAGQSGQFGGRGQGMTAAALRAGAAEDEAAKVAAASRDGAAAWRPRGRRLRKARPLPRPRRHPAARTRSPSSTRQRPFLKR